MLSLEKCSYTSKVHTICIYEKWYFQKNVMVVEIKVIKCWHRCPNVFSLILKCFAIHFQGSYCFYSPLYTFVLLVSCFLVEVKDGTYIWRSFSSIILDQMFDEFLILKMKMIQLYKYMGKSYQFFQKGVLKLLQIFVKIVGTINSP